MGDRLSVAVGLNNVGAQQLDEKLVAACEIFTLMVERDLIYEPWGCPVFHTRAGIELVV